MSDQIKLKPIQEADGSRLIAMNIASRSFHSPWVAPPATEEEFAAYFSKIRDQRTIGYAILTPPDDIVGIVNLNNVVWGSMKGAALGYYASAAYAGTGLFRKGLAAVIDHSFREEGLHRLEANIQPGNFRSLRLVERLGFSKEGFSRKLLFIDGDWRDHERWAILAEDWEQRRREYLP
jgi:ribosomal-protein-alanine N-acetyltransferase